MDLPPRLRAALDTLARRRSITELKEAGETLSRRYRAETRDGRLHLSGRAAAEAYAAARMPATFAAVRWALGEIADAAPHFAPESLLDVGSGPGTALWAAEDLWPLRSATLVETSPSIREVSRELAQGAFPFEPRHVEGDAAGAALRALEPADLVSLAYVLDELDPAAIPVLADGLWSLTGGILLVVEPGTPAGWRRVLAVRTRLLAAGAHPVAPCPHAQMCPVREPDWCHFARRLARSREHRLIKGGEAPFEDEKFAFLAVSRETVAAPAARVLASPREASGRVALKLCTAEGELEQRLVTRRDGDRFREAKRLRWGDAARF